ncbi:MAG: DNA polymerase IV [Chloroflexi bacterium]|nr:DNA polymerase IV [Chloroflexota bacterium]
MNRKIIHIDLDAFYCAVEELHDPTLRGKAFAVGGKANRGVIVSCSYAARQLGIHSAMPSSRAVRLCPHLIIVSRRHGDYSTKSRQVMEILRSFTPLVEQISIDEAFLDISSLKESGETYARILQKKISDELGLPSSFGVASNKLVAKIATNVGKASQGKNDYPKAIQAVPPGAEAAFLAPLPAEALWGVGPKTAARLEDLSIFTIGDVAKQSNEDLRGHFGKVGPDLVRRARGIDTRKVQTSRVAKSVSKEVTFSRDTTDENKLKETMRWQSKSISKRLKKSNLTGATIKIKIRWSDFTTISRQSTLPQPTNNPDPIFNTAIQLLNKYWKPRRPIRLLGLGISGLQSPPRQLTLWEIPKYDNQSNLQAAVNELRKRYGDQSIRKARDLDF